ncbi:hemerythrin domain-containing protein [Noviherbaspirillum sp.]|uniref:hemerythrin domain-containing protein n=1 Tax=Noviherbaspirillum sp. TaxID=1926288 RepID=UPI002FE33C3D
MRLPPSQLTIRIIQEEHDCLMAVIRSMKQLASDMQVAKKAPDLKVFRAMLLYICDYPEKVHHPKEDFYLFSPLRRRTDRLDGVLSELETQHALGDAMVRRIEHALNRYELQGGEAMNTFVNLVMNYAEFYIKHMHLEEDVVLPASVQLFTAEDWDTVNTAFILNEKSVAGTSHKKEFERLFSLITNITPAPIGLGPAIA